MRTSFLFIAVAALAAACSDDHQPTSPNGISRLQRAPSGDVAAELVEGGRRARSWREKLDLARQILGGALRLRCNLGVGSLERRCRGRVRFGKLLLQMCPPLRTQGFALFQGLAAGECGLGELIAQHKKTPIPGVTEEYIQQQLKPVMPDIDPSFFRKYVAYSKRSCFPILSIEAKEALVGYYLKLRGIAEPNKPVPVTARQLEALVRLAEASARIRLSDTIEQHDAGGDQQHGPCVRARSPPCERRQASQEDGPRRQQLHDPPAKNQNAKGVEQHEEEGNGPRHGPGDERKK